MILIVQNHNNILIENGTIITMDPNRRIIMNGSLYIEKDRIIDVGEPQKMKNKYNGDLVIDATHNIVMPGLFDGHCHAGHSLLRSLGMHNETWYQACQVIYSQASNLDYWTVDAQLLNLERLKFGTTCGLTFFGGGDSVMRVDNPKYADSHCDIAEKIGIRTYLAVGPRRPPFPSEFSEWVGKKRRDYNVNFEDQIKVCEHIVERNRGRGNSRVNIALMHPTPHPEVKPIKGEELEDLKQQTKIVRDMSRNYRLLFSMDGHTCGTVQFCHDELELTGPDALFSHSTELTQEELMLCADTSTRIVHNPSAVASILGRCPVPELLDVGVTVVLGSDAGAPDRSFDMFRHMFQCMRYHRRHYRDSRILPPGKVLEMVTIDAAKAFGIDDMVGSIEQGKKADIIIIDAFKPHIYPLNMPVDRLTYFANGNDVDTVIVDGKVLMQNRRVTTINEADVLENAQVEIEAAVDRSELKKLYDITDRYWGYSRF